MIRGLTPQPAYSFQFLFLLVMWGGNWEKECVPCSSREHRSFRDMFLEHTTSNFSSSFIYAFQKYSCAMLQQVWTCRVNNGWK